jgi:hypothetical protein
VNEYTVETTALAIMAKTTVFGLAGTEGESYNRFKIIFAIINNRLHKFS